MEPEWADFLCWSLGNALLDFPMVSSFLALSRVPPPNFPFSNFWRRKNAGELKSDHKGCSCSRDQAEIKKCCQLGFTGVKKCKEFDGDICFELAEEKKGISVPKLVYPHFFSLSSQVYPHPNPVE